MNKETPFYPNFNICFLLFLSVPTEEITLSYLLLLQHKFYQDNLHYVYTEKHEREYHLKG